MAGFALKSQRQSATIVAKLSGTLNEDARFSQDDLSGVTCVNVDFKDVESINSCGVRTLIEWLNTIPLQSQVNYQNCPKIVIDQINMVGGLLRQGGKIESFYTPYYCDNCDFQTNILFESGKEFVGASLTPPKNVACSKCKGLTEIDVIADKYFKFLRR